MNKARNARRPVYLSLLCTLLFAVYPVLAYYAHNAEQLANRQLMFPLLVVAMIAAVAYSIAFLLSGNHLKAAAGSCIFLFFFWFFDAVAGFLPPGQTTAEAALAVVMLGIGLILFFAMKRIKKTQNLLSLIYILLIPIALLVGFNLAVSINAEHKKTTTAGLTRTVTVIPEG
ncbi:MAG: hypothetical protein RG741_06515 [Bacteroidales bacterium]|nr:hypothetical protein [Bacteroidales bacterium]